MEFAMGKPADDSGTRPRVNSRVLPPLYKQVEVQQGWQDKQAQLSTHWSTAAAWTGMAGFSSKSLVLVSLLGLLALLLCGTSEAQSNQDCCLSYTKVRLPRWALKGYTEQRSSEVCDIHAIIFHTYSGLNACVNPREGWVKKHLLFLSHKLKKMAM
ncbi:LOW QUALITY PROTEIN: C-C motif chemokine 20 [Phoenicopterus ruber ruber]